MSSHHLRTIAEILLLASGVNVDVVSEVRGLRCAGLVGDGLVAPARGSA